MGKLEYKKKEIKQERALDFMQHEEQYEKLGIFIPEGSRLRGTRLKAQGLL